MTTILGNRVGNGSVIESFPHLYARSGGSITYSSEAYEAFVRQTAGAASELSDFVQAAERGSYLFFNENWPPNNIDARWTRDAQAGKLIMFSAKTGGPTWLQASQGSMDANIIARGNQLKNFMDQNPSVSLAFSPHHEPNNGDAASSGTSGSSTEAQGVINWWRMYERIVSLWDDLEIPRWVGTQAGVTTTPGMIYAGPNLAGSAQVTGPAVYDTYYRTPATEPWGWDNIQMACFDMYQGSASGGGTWRAFEEMAGATPSRAGFVSWFTPKRNSQNALGKVLLGSIWEFACDEFDKRWPNSSTLMFTSTSPYWDSLGLADTMPAWLEHMGDWVTANPTIFHSLMFWDSCAVSGGQPSGRGPHMIDMTQSSWNAWVDVLHYPVFGYAGQPPDPPDPPDPPGNFVGAIAPSTRVKTAA